MTPITTTTLKTSVNSEAPSTTPSENRCNGEDANITETNEAEVINALRNCAGWTCTGECAATCIKKKLGLSVECASCFGGISSCARENCKWECILSTTSSKCLNCVKRNCEKPFKDCSGLELWSENVGYLPEEFNR